MNAYLRPETLFGTKFESYLNEKNIIEKPKVDYNDFIPKAMHCFTVDHDGYCENPTYTGSGKMLTMCKICKDNKDKWKGS
jgi:hypothetical protein